VQHPPVDAVVLLLGIEPLRRQELVEVGADDPVGARRGERVTGAAVVLEQVLALLVLGSDLDGALERYRAMKGG
jgi:hypothetical protein